MICLTPEVDIYFVLLVPDGGVAVIQRNLVDLMVLIIELRISLESDGTARSVILTCIFLLKIYNCRFS